MKKYRFVTNFEPTFPDIKTGFKKFKHIIEDDEELKKIFPHGIKHFQVSEKRRSKILKRFSHHLILAFQMKINHKIKTNTSMK